MHNGRRNGNVGRWLTAVLRTLNMCRYWHERWMDPDDGGGVLSKLPDYMSCRFPPMDIFPEEDGDEYILTKHPPMPLHLKLVLNVFHLLLSGLILSGLILSGLILSHMAEFIMFIFHYRGLSTKHFRAWKTSTLLSWITSSLSTSMREEGQLEVNSLGG